MISIAIKSNLKEVLQRTAGQLEAITSNEGQLELTRAVAVSLRQVVHDRIHVDGLDASGAQIGTYSPGYMKVRTGNYPETVLKSGKNKGKFRDKKKAGQAGTFTRGKHKGEPRPVYNRTSDTKVVLSLTKTMELDFSVIAASEKSYGLGFKNEDNYIKSLFAQITYKKKIYGLTETERDLIAPVVIKFIQDALRG